MKIWDEMVKYEEMIRKINPGIKDETVRLFGQAFMTGAQTQREMDLNICKEVALSAQLGGPPQSGAVSVQILIEKTAF